MLVRRTSYKSIEFATVEINATLPVTNLCISIVFFPLFCKIHVHGPESLAESNLIPRAHMSFGQRQDTELWNNPFEESKILGLPVSRRMCALALKRHPEVKSMWIHSTKAFNTHSHRLYI